MNKKEVSKLIKRFFIAFAICLPLFVVIGIFLTPIIGNVWSVVIYVVIGLGVFFLEEAVYKKIAQKKQEAREKALLKRKYQKAMNSKLENFEQNSKDNLNNAGKNKVEKNNVKNSNAENSSVEEGNIKNNNTGKSKTK